ncbi:hypothetical protein F5890DRAFT_1494046 [Lentinula detonsa]|uniref:DUF4139 domain-containing protein n=1 Tax=Lentinula detonsa TaxID=2804962 RepID=A0AA38Q7I8_9AGAR|nr:hypothetical protein F5890DRAFT_1494046 [Lentinula detonsa]
MTATICVFAPHHPTKSITIFKPSNLAEIVRSFLVEFKPGRNIVEIIGLSSDLDADSVIVTGLGSGTNNILRLDDVTASIACTDPVTPDIQHAGTFYETWSSLSKLVVPERAASFLSPPGEISKQTLEERQAGVSEERIERKAGLLRGKVEVYASNSGSEVRKVELKLSYTVANVGWEPIYELHAHTLSDTGELSLDMTLHVRARISQTTGEDWKNAPLKLSTLADRNLSHIPSLTRVTLAPSFETTPPNSTSSISTPPTNPVNTKLNMNPDPPLLPSVQPDPPTAIFGQPGRLGSGYKVPPKMSIPISGGFSTYAANKPASFAPPAGSVNIFNSTSKSLSGGKMSPPTGSTSDSLPSTSDVFFNSSPSPNTLSILGQSASTLGPGATANGQFRGHSPSALQQQSLPTMPASATAPPVQSFSPVETSIISNSSSLLYSMESPVNITSDGFKHNVRVAELQLSGGNVEIEHVVVPRMDSTVFRQCRITNSTDSHLLPGSVSVIIDDALVARTNIKRVNPNDTFVCALGSDSNVSVTYSSSSRTVASSIGSPKVNVYTNTVTLTNRHSFDLRRINVRDAVPIWQPSNKASDKDCVHVLLKKPGELRDAVRTVVAKNVEGQERKNVSVAWEDKADGLFAWTVDIPGGKTEQLELEWEVDASQCGAGGGLYE